MTEPVIVNFFSHVAHIRLNQPERGNVVNNENLHLLYQNLVKADQNPECRVIVIEGRDGVFCRGMDFEYLLQQTEKPISVQFSKPYLETVMQIRNSNKPVIAAVDGQVLAGGMGIMLACDIILATKNSSFGLSEALFGLIPAYVFPFLLERVPFKKARYMVLSSKVFQAEEAYQLGLIDEFVEAERFEKHLKSILKRLLYSSPDSLRLTKQYSDHIQKLPLEQAIKEASLKLTELLNNPETLQAIAAFMNGEKMPWAASYKKFKSHT